MSSAGRAGSVTALLVTAVGSGAVAGVLAAAFIWIVEQGTELIWTDLPERFGVDPFRSWWLFAIPLAGGLLVGLGQRILGNYPEPIDSALATWKSGGRMDPVVVPKTFVNSLVALVAGGPVGFEAALTGIIGGTASWIGDRIRSVGRLVRQAWGADSVDSMPAALHHLPYWLAAVGGLLAFKWVPFGGMDLGFRFSAYEGGLEALDALAMFVFAALVVVPVAWALALVTRAEHATFFRRSPILIAMAGAVVFSLMAIPNDLVLFSGQQGIQQLTDVSGAGLAYLTLAKWLALVVALFAGWRGGPVFPTFTAVAAFAVLVSGPVHIEADLLMVAGIAAVSVVFVKGRLPLAFVLSLYPVPLSYTVVIVVGCLGAAVALAVSRSLGVLPAGDDAGAPAAASTSS